MVDDILDFVHHAVLKQPHPYCSSTHGSHFSPETFRTIVADHGNLVPAL